MRALALLVVFAALGAIPPAPVASQESEDAPSSVPHVVQPEEGECRTPWTDGLRRPERFTLILDCITVMGTVIDVRNEADGDLHIPLRLDDDPGILNARNIAGQRGGLLVEIEPWQRGGMCAALGCDGMVGRDPSPYCPDFCAPRAGDRLRVTSAIVTDNEPGHGWNLGAQSIVDRGAGCYDGRAGSGGGATGRAGPGFRADDWPLLA